MSNATPHNSDALAATGGQAAHFRGLESLYLSAPINRLFESHLTITAEGVSRIEAMLAQMGLA